MLCFPLYNIGVVPWPDTPGYGRILKSVSCNISSTSFRGYHPHSSVKEVKHRLLRCRGTSQGQRGLINSTRAKARVNHVARSSMAMVPVIC